jgi:hypothetical protein
MILDLATDEMERARVGIATPLPVSHSSGDSTSLGAGAGDLIMGASQTRGAGAMIDA